MSTPVSEIQETSSLKKWIISFVSGLIFFALASPLIFKLVGGLTQRVGLKIQSGGCPNYYGLAVHAVVFVLIVRVMMW